MNDTELDEMLNQWKAPEPGMELRDRVRAMQPRKRRFSWPSWENSKGMIFGLSAGAAMFLFAVGIAAPQTFTSGSSPFIVESEYIAHQKDGSTVVTEYRTSYLRNGVPTILSNSFPDNPLMTLHNRFFYAMQNLMYPLARQIHGEDRLTAFYASLVRNGCVEPAGGKLVGHENILGYDTAIVQVAKWPGWTGWRTPALGCIELKDTWEEPVADGSSHLAREMKALRIKMNRPQ